MTLRSKDDHIKGMLNYNQGIEQYKRMIVAQKS